MTRWWRRWRQALWLLVHNGRRTTCPRRMREVGPWEKKPFQDWWRLDETCSFCGGLLPEVFFHRVRLGDLVLPTDKSYKAYLVSAGRQRKVYFQHFSSDDQALFLRLLTSATMRLGAPGHFYVRPFFLTEKKRTEG